MASQCTDDFSAIAQHLGGFTRRQAPAFLHLRNPLALSNWTLPALELMMVATGCGRPVQPRCSLLRSPKRQANPAGTPLRRPARRRFR
jgi:hypothetical protein